MLRTDLLLAMACGTFFLTAQAAGRAGPLPAPCEERAASLGHGPQGAGDDVPEGLAAAEWCGIRAAHEACRHAVHAVEGGYRARNPGQAWQTLFDGRGFTVQPDAGGWEWGLELAGYGFAGHERVVREPLAVHAAGQRVAYEWDGILEEWYVNDARGLEHGYTLRERPARGTADEPGPLVLTLAVRGELRAEVGGRGRDLCFVDVPGTAVLVYAGLTVFDADGRELAAGFERSAEGLVLSIDERGARYPLTIDPLVQRAYLKASNTGADDEFGESVAISGDTVVVGARFEDSDGSGVNGTQGNNLANGSGAVYVFVRDGTTWSQQAYLKASNPGLGDIFGASVAVDGDTIVIGAPLEDSNAVGVNGDQGNDSAANSGAAYVFLRSGTSWSQEAYLKASNTDAEDEFGMSVAVDGDTIVIGTRSEDSNAKGVNGDQENDSAPFSGAAYVFLRSGTSWSQQAYLKASNTEAFDNFGISVAVSGDIVVVGAPEEDSGSANQNSNAQFGCGAAYVFARDRGTWAQEAYLKSIHGVANEKYGLQVAASGNSVVVQGIVGQSTDAFVTDGSAWSRQAHIQAVQSGGVSLAGDVLVLNQFVYVRNGTVWSLDSSCVPSNPDPDDRFGSAVGVSGSTIVIGAPWEDSASTGVNGTQGNASFHAGAAYVFELFRFEASVGFRNAGSNPATYAADPVVLGGMFQASVDNASASQFTSILIAFDTPFSAVLPGGQTLLCLDLGGRGEIFTGAGLAPLLPVFFGTDTYSFPLANDYSVLGLVIYSQAIQFGNPPFVLSNAQDLAIGTF